MTTDTDIDLVFVEQEGKWLMHASGCVRHAMTDMHHPED